MESDWCVSVHQCSVYSEEKEIPTALLHWASGQKGIFRERDGEGLWPRTELIFKGSLWVSSIWKPTTNWAYLGRDCLGHFHMEQTTNCSHFCTSTEHGIFVGLFYYKIDHGENKYQHQIEENERRKMSIICGYPRSIDGKLSVIWM